jgi:hypothetical protein
MPGFADEAARLRVFVCSSDESYLPVISGTGHERVVPVSPPPVGLR